MKFASSLFAAIFVAVSLAPPAVARATPPDLSAAKALYAAASYEEALVALSKGDGEEGDPVGQVEQYRALCLLALGRTNEARQSLERMVVLQPRYTITDADVSPRLVTMLHDVRKQLLPAAAKDIYAKAKASFETRQYAAASAQLKDMFAILADADMPEQAAGLGDLKMLGEGFLALAEAQLAAAQKMAGPASAPSSPGSRASAPASLSAPAATSTPPPPEPNPVRRVYSGSDKDVTAPVEIDRTMPPWTPANAADRSNLHSGLVTIIIDEKGAVESAAIQKSVAASYDGVLLAAAKKWQFKPARLNGQPVKYWVSYEMVLRAR